MTDINHPNHDNTPDPNKMNNSNDDNHEGKPSPNEERGEADHESTSKDTYEVGYGKPPVASQFKPRQSGNKDGRPKGRRNLATLLRKAIGEEIIISEGGKPRKMSKGEAAILALVHRALRGNDRAFAKMIDLAQKTGEFRLPDSGGSACGVLEVDTGCLTSAEFVARYGTESLSTKEGIDAYERDMQKACEEMRERARNKEAWLKRLEELFGKKPKLDYPNAF